MSNWSNQMLKINWSQLKDVQNQLLRQGFKNNSNFIVRVVFKKGTPDSYDVHLKDICVFIFNLDIDPNISGVYLYDETGKNPIWMQKAASTSNKANEEVAPTGHSFIVQEFAHMDPEQKRIWVEVTAAQAAAYIADGDSKWNKPKNQD